MFLAEIDVSVLTVYYCDVLHFASSSYEPCSTILYPLETGRQSFQNTVEQCVSVFEAWCNQWIHKGFAGVSGNILANAANVAYLVLTSFRNSIHLLLHRKEAVKKYTQIVHSRSSLDSTSTNFQCEILSSLRNLLRWEHDQFRLVLIQLQLVSAHPWEYISQARFKLFGDVFPRIRRTDDHIYLSVIGITVIQHVMATTYFFTNWFGV